MRRFVTHTPAIAVFAVAIAATLTAPKVFRQFQTAHTAASITLATQSLEESNILEAIDRATIAVADIVRPSVVHLDVGRGGGRGFLRRGSGSGWIYDEQGHVVTNAHVVRGARAIEAQFPDGRVAQATVVGDDPFTDIAVLKLDNPGTVFPIQRATDAVPRQGQRGFAFGSPFGFKFSMTEGIVSGLGRDPANARDFGGFTNYIQTDAAVNPGNSGGPLVNVNGRLIGMNVAIATASDTQGTNEGDSAGISFAIPLGPIESVVTQIIDSGRVERGYLGIQFARLPVTRVETDDEVYAAGVRVSEVVPEGPSDKAGLRSGDVIVSLKDQPITTYNVLSSIVGISKPGAKLEATIVRDQQAKDITVELGRMPDEVLARRAGESIVEQTGLYFANLRDLTSAPVIGGIFPGSRAGQLGFERGQRVVSVAGEPVESVEDVFKVLYERRVLSGNTVEFLVVPPGEDPESAESIDFDMGY